MVFANVRVTSAIAGTEFLPWTTFQCAGLIEQVLSALGSRPGRVLNLFHHGVMVREVQLAPEDRVELKAVVSDALTVEQRKALVETLVSHEIHDYQVFNLFAGFAEGARDDKVSFLPRSKGSASPSCLRASCARMIGILFAQRCGKMAGA